MYTNIPGRDLSNMMQQIHVQLLPGSKHRYHREINIDYMEVIIFMFLKLGGDPGFAAYMFVSKALDCGEVGGDKCKYHKGRLSVVHRFFTFIRFETKI